MATSDSVKQHKLRKLIACISEQKGRGIEFISLYIPNGTPVDAVVATLKKELDCALTAPQNDRAVKNRIEDATKNIIQYLKLQKEIPNNGLAIFAGTFANDSETKVLNIEEVTPPEPITTYLYQVDDHFHLELLREMLRNQKDVGFFVLDSKEASFGIIKGEQFKLIENITSGIHGKSGKGGSSQRRYERERDMAVSNFFHRVAEHATKAFLEDHKVVALIVGGPGTTKEDFLKGDYLNYELQNSVVTVVDTQSAGKDAVKEMVDKSADVRQSMCSPDERRIVQRLMKAMGKQDGLAIYGLDPVLMAIKKGEVEVALVTDTTDMLETVAVCKKCGLSKEQMVGRRIRFMWCRK